MSRAMTPTSRGVFGVVPQSGGLSVSPPIPQFDSPPRPASAAGLLLCLPAMIADRLSLIIPPVPSCAKHVRPGSGTAWFGVTGNPSGYPSPSSSPCRNRQTERSWCPPRGLLRGKPSAAGLGKRPRTVLTEEKRPEAFPNDGKAGCRV